MSEAGKGDKPRLVNKKQFDENYDRIFGMKKTNDIKPIPEKMYGDNRDNKMKRVCRCVDCKQLFTGEKGDAVCGVCEKKPELNNENNSCDAPT